MALSFGNRAEWERFNKMFPVFGEKYDALVAMRDKIFVRHCEAGSKVDRVVFGLGRVCSEDFQQALILCGNGFGIGALQIVRGMYEREVTAAYLSSHSDEVDDFLDYHDIQTRKALNHLKDSYNGDELSELISKEKQQEIEESFNAVKDKFTEIICKTCNKTRTMFSWSKHHVGVLAKQGGQGLEIMYFAQYFLPTLLSHSTAHSVLERLIENENGELSFESEGQTKRVRDAVINAHVLLICVFNTQNIHFKLGLDDELEKLTKDYEDCWLDKTQNTKG